MFIICKLHPIPVQARCPVLESEREPEWLLDSVFPGGHCRDVPGEDQEEGRVDEQHDHAQFHGDTQVGIAHLFNVRPRSSFHCVEGLEQFEAVTHCGWRQEELRMKRVGMSTLGRTYCNPIESGRSDPISSEQLERDEEHEPEDARGSGGDVGVSEEGREEEGHG